MCLLWPIVAKPNAGRNIYQIDPWQCKESNGTPIENSSRRSISTVVSTTNRQPCVCVCVNFSNFCDTNLHKLYDIFLLFFFWASIFTRAFVSRVPQQFRQRSCWTCFLGPGSHHRGSPGLLLGHFSPRQTPDPCWYSIIDGRGEAGIRSCTEPLRVSL